MQQTRDGGAGPLSFGEALDAAGEKDEIPNYERGCGSLDHDATYIRADVSAFASAAGEIPTFVELDEYIPYREGHFRTFKRINGTEFLLEATQGDHALTSEIPRDEVLAHVNRSRADPPRDDQAGGLRSHVAQDLLMWVGKSYYPEPADFISEARYQGISKKIPASANQEPPTIRPFRTRVFLIHPRAIPTGKDEDGNVIDVTDDAVEWDDQEFIPAIVGYSYLTRSVHTADVEGEHADAFKQMAEKREDVDCVAIGEFIDDDSPDHPEHEDNEFTPAVEVPRDPVGDLGEVGEPSDSAENEPIEKRETFVGETTRPFPGRDLSEALTKRIESLPGNTHADVQAHFRDPDGEYSDMDFHDMRGLAKRIEVGSALDSNPSSADLRTILGAIPVFHDLDGDLRVEVEGEAYTVEEFEDAEPLVKNRALMCALEAIKEADAA